MEQKNALSQKKSVARVILGKGNFEDWRTYQREDASVSLRKEGLSTSSSFGTSVGRSARIYWSYWDALILEDGLLHKRWEAPNLRISFLQLIVPRKRVKEILEQAHSVKEILEQADFSSGGHFGVNKTLEKIRKRFYWATCKQDIENWCSSCKIYAAKRGPSGKGKSPLQIFNVGIPLERVQMDVLGSLPPTFSGNRYLLVIVDCFTKWVEAFPLKNIRTKSVAEIFVSQFISRHGVPSEIHTDQGKNFESKLFSELTELLGIKKTRITPFHPQSDGQVERQHQTISNYLSKFISENQRDWDRWIPMFLLAYRSSKHESTGVTPAELYFARDLRLPLNLLRENPPVHLEEDSHSTKSYVQKLKDKLEAIHLGFRNRLNIKSSRVKTWYNKKARQTLFDEGQKVWLWNPRRVKDRTPKLQSNWESSYSVFKKLSEVVYCIQKSPRHRKKIVHADCLAPFFERRLN